MKILCFIIAMLASLRLELATAAETSPPETPSITVEAMREREALSHRIDHFVSHVITVPADGALSRWHEPICPMVGGFTQDIGEYMLTKLSTFARTANVPLAGEKCKPNFAVLLAAHPDQLIEAWSKRQRGLFGDADGWSVKRFKHAETAVRVWYNFALVATDSSSDGSTAMAGLNASGSQIGGTQALQGVPNFAVGSLSRLTHNTANDMQSVIVLIDSGQAHGVTYGQLASYIAMVGFLRI
jgi:hypothetical protein